MSIDFEDLEVLLAELAAAGVEAPRPEVRDRLMAKIRADEPVLPVGFVFNLSAADGWVPTLSLASACASWP